MADHQNQAHSTRDRLIESSFLDPGLPVTPKRNMVALACALLACLSSILLGYDTGVMSGAKDFIQEDLKITDVQVEVMVGTINIYSLLGSAIAGKTCDWIGRRYTLAVAGAIFFAGAFLMALATNYAFLMCGRFVAGIGVGFAMMIAPVYSSEISPRSTRGFITSFTEVFINLGVLLGYISNYFFAKMPTNLGWRFMMGVGAIPSAALIIGGFLMPESPRWLVMQGRIGEARNVLIKSSESMMESQERLADIVEAAGIPEAINNDVVEVPRRKSGGRGVWKEMFVHPSPAVLHITIAGIGVCFFQQACGIDSVVIYSLQIFEMAGITSENGRLLGSIAVGLTKTVCVLVATFFLDRFGRRILLLTSSGALVCSMFSLAICLTWIDLHPNETANAVIVACVVFTLACVGTFSIGMGPVAWVYSSEVFPLRLRAQGSAMASGVNRLVSGVILMTYISLYQAITIGGSFFLFGGITLLAFIFFYTLLPETRGRGLEEMEEMFGTFFRWRTTVKELEEREKLYNSINSPEE